MPQPLRFGIIRNYVLPWPETLAQYQRFEAAGFDSIWGVDHFMRPSDPGGPHFDSWTMLAAIAACTTRARLGIMVSSNTFRHPALLAKQAVTVDHISGGRLEIGIGAGNFLPEHEAFGFPFPPPAERVARFREAVEIVDRLMRQDVTTYDGRYYQLKEAPFRPGPVQKPRPPLTLGAHGQKMLRLAAEYADRWNSFGPLEEMRARNEQLDAACAAVGRDPESIIRSTYIWARVLGVDPWASPAAFGDLVGQYRAVGCNEFIFEPPTEPARWAVLDRVVAEVLPGLRSEI